MDSNIVWASYFLQLKLTAPIILQPREIKCLKTGLRIFKQQSSFVCICRDEGSFTSSYFTYIDPTDYGNITIAVQNISDVNLDLNNFPLIVNIFAFSLPNINLVTLPVQTVNNIDHNYIPHGECRAQFILYGSQTRLRAHIKKIRWIEMQHDEPTHYKFSCEFWIDLQNTPPDQIFNSAKVEFVSNRSVYFKQIILYQNVLTVRAFYENSYLINYETYPEDIFFQLNFIQTTPHIVMERNLEPVIKYNKASITVGATRNIISSTITPFSCSYQTFFDSKEKYAALFIPRLINGISLNTFIWKERTHLQITMRAHKRNCRIDYSQELGKLIFLPSQMMQNANSNVDFGWTETSRIIITHPNNQTSTIRSENYPVPQIPTLSTIPHITAATNASINLNSLNLNIAKEHLVPIRYSIKLDKRMQTVTSPSALPHTLTILEGNIGLQSIPCPTGNVQRN
ncbi:tegument protein pp65 [macacine betaherpesvirus 9]|uniref:Tegument protein pp65 n=1 Tax=macacine betaherpesvirus 9 TaxID=2560568 RepID=A0A192XNW7_9BETA|nr:tegument protein pp65 [macacine betaherpesvirus 9]ANC96547.1 tegument protein pp65 [macacine betaherpesvirus 9]